MKTVAGLSFAAVLSVCASATAYEYRFRWVERVGDTDVIIGGCGATLDVRLNTGPRRLRLEIGVFGDAASPAPAGGFVGWINGVITVSGPPSNSQDRRTPGRIEPFNWFTSGMSNGDPLPAGGIGGPDADDFDFQRLTYIYASLGVQTLTWGCGEDGQPLPQPYPMAHGRDTYVAVYEVTTDPIDSNTRNYTITFSGNVWSASYWRIVGDAIPPDCELGLPGVANYAPFPAGWTPLDCTLHIAACDTAPQLTEHPEAVTRTPGETATFSVHAIAATPLAYQWRRNGSDLADGGPISGATTSMLAIQPVSAADHGSVFTCMVSDACDSVISTAAALTICGAPTWSAIGTGVNPGGSIHALAVLPSGDIIAGGDFTEVGGVPAARIARWDGISWHPLGSGMNGDVYALAVPAGGDVVAGGNFTMAGGTPVNRVARWHGDAWQQLGAGAPGTVYALAVLATGDVVSGGASPGGGLVQKWNGISWTPFPPLNDAVRALAIIPASFRVT